MKSEFFLWIGNPKCQSADNILKPRWAKSKYFLYILNKFWSACKPWICLNSAYKAIVYGSYAAFNQ
jgi:hypothetical protein